MPASNYYALAASLVLAFFFLVWGILHDGGEETPWFTAGIGASIILFGAVILREIVLRRAHKRYLLLQRSFDKQLVDVYSRIPSDRHSEKLSIEQNAAILRDIEKKSKAAKTLGNLAAVHREVLDLCGEYLALNERELAHVGSGSPRLVPLRKSRERVARYHRFHMLKWAEIEVRDRTFEAGNRLEMNEKVEAGQGAINVIDTALQFYPDERTLIESRGVLIEMLASIQVTRLVEKAEREAFKANYDGALSLYRDALFYLGRDNVSSSERDQAALRINAEIERLRHLQSG